MATRSRMKLSRSAYWFLALSLLILSVDSAIVHLMAEERLLAYAVLFDFMLVIPFCYWLLVIRKTSRKWTAVLPLPVLGGLAAWLIFPSSLKDSAWHAVWPVELLIMAAEAAFIFYEIRLLVLVVRRFRQLRRVEPNTGEAIRLAVKDVLGEGKLASVLVHDASMIYYIFFSWGARKRQSQPDAGTEFAFTYHKETNQVLMAAIVTKIIVLESIAAHLLLAMWSPIAAWLVTISELWLLMLIWADTRAAALQPIRMNGDRLRLRYGLRIQAELQWSDIESVEWSKAGYELTHAERKLSAGPGFGTPNVKIMLKREVRAEGMLFLPRQVKSVYLAVDEPQRFVQQAEIFMTGAGAEHK